MKALTLTLVVAALSSCTTTYKQTASGDVEFSTTIIPVDQDSKK